MHDRAEGDDHAISLEPADLARLVEGVREVEASLGSSHKVLSARELRDRAIVRRSLHVGCTIPKGTVLREEMLRIVRPSDGLPPEFAARVVGRAVCRDLEAGDPIRWEDI